MKSILDPSFRYSPSFDTDVKKTFARIRRKMRQELVVTQAPLNVSSIVRNRPTGLPEVGKSTLWRPR
ncbi:MAG TPA: hypothetical protein VFQ93_02730 [Casimicrobiaceae bacterium]|nr:hypothetical protein [Casimicrobiaceae bacterium]